MASGKSYVARLLEERGAQRLDLDQISRDILAPGTQCVEQIAQAFGADVLDAATETLNRQLLAERVFASKEATQRLEAIELPEIKRSLCEHLARLRQCEHLAHLRQCENFAHLHQQQDLTHLCQYERAATQPLQKTPLVVVVEIPLLDRVEDLIPLADELVFVSCPYKTRVARAIQRGMNVKDVEARMQQQVSDAWLRRHCDVELINDDGPEKLSRQLDVWWSSHEQTFWESHPYQQRGVRSARLIGSDTSLKKEQGGQSS